MTKKKRMKTPISYYGGKQKLATLIIGLFPDSFDLYGEPFFGGGAVFWEKEPSKVEVINDTNNQLINFYSVVKEDFRSLQKEIDRTLHSRTQHRFAVFINTFPEHFDRIKRAWAIWVLAAQGFASKLNGAWGYDITKNQTSLKIQNKKENFTMEYAKRLEHIQIECTDALRIIKSRDSKKAFFYCDPPYYNSDCAHYGGYSLQDFEELLKTLSQIKGRFLLSSYPSEILNVYREKYGWDQIEIKQKISIENNRPGKRPKIKTEVLTANYPLRKHELNLQ